MRYCLVTYGSRGDVQPFIYLAQGLKTRGHEVTLAAPENFQQLITGYGIDFYPLAGDAEELIRSPEFRKVIKNGSHIAFARLAIKEMKGKRLSILQGVYEVCQDADIIVCVTPCLFYVSTVAEKLNKKWVLIQLNPPMIPTREFPMLMSIFPDSKWLNRYSYTIIIRGLWLAQKKEYRLFRKTLGLPFYKGRIFDKVMNEKVPMIHAFSPELISRPSDWDEHVTIGGFLIPKPDNSRVPKLTRCLEEWIQAGEKPLYIGFGSIPFPDTAKLTEIINDLLDKTDLRIIYCRGWSDLPDLKPNPRLLVIEQADHNWLLPKCQAAVIHGGIGTVAAVMQAGIPVIVASLFVDQPAWGKIIERKRLGVHIPWRKLSALAILNALMKVKQEPTRSSIKESHERLMKEDGIATTIATIEAYGKQ
jgi:sterol 3beta-glucosyltransferase